MSERAEAEAQCAFALGRLDGLLAGLNDAETRLFCASLVRETLGSALCEVGLAAVASQFDGWFAGLARPLLAPDASSPSEIVSAILSELGHSSWPPLAETARAIAAAGRFERAPCSIGDIGPAVARAADHVAAAGRAPLPFAPLARLCAALAADPLFAPIERAPRLLSLRRQIVALNTAAQRTPLWAVSLHLGALFGREPSLPFPGAITAQLLGPQLWPNERATLAARALLTSTERLINLLAMARRGASLATHHLAHLRSSSRARVLWTLLVGFAPLGPEQVAAALAVSRRGTYAIGDALVAAGLARRHRVRGRMLLIGLDRHDKRQLSTTDIALSPTVDEFDAALADIDRLLARSDYRSR